MSQFFPLGVPISASMANHTIQAISSSEASSSTISVTTVVSASVTLAPGIPGSSGENQNPNLCDTGPLGPSGSKGLPGPSGSSITECPSGYKMCSGLTKSGYSIVCIQVPSGYTEETTYCPQAV